MTAVRHFWRQHDANGWVLVEKANDVTYEHRTYMILPHRPLQEQCYMCHTRDGMTSRGVYLQGPLGQLAGLAELCIKCWLNCQERPISQRTGSEA